MYSFTIEKNYISGILPVEDTRGYCSLQQILGHVLKRRLLFALEFMDSFLSSEV
jgi:hypothetical protein